MAAPAAHPTNVAAQNNNAAQPSAAQQQAERAVVLATAGFDHTIRSAIAERTADARSTDSARSSLSLCPVNRCATLCVCSFWEAPTGLCHRTLQYTDSQVNRLCITPDKQYLAVAGNPHVRLYEIHTQNPSPLTSFDGHTSNVTAVGFQKDRKWMFTGSEDGSVKIWVRSSDSTEREQTTG